MSHVITSKAQQDREDALLAVAALAGFPVIIASVIGAVFLVGAWAAFVLYKLYGWFVVPLGAPVLNWWHIWGLVLVYHTLTYRSDRDDATPSKSWKASLAKLVARVLGLAAVLLVGWLIHGQI